MRQKKIYKIGRLTFDQWPYHITEIVINDQDRIQISKDCVFARSYGFSFRHSIEVSTEVPGGVIQKKFETHVHHMTYERRWQRDWEVIKLLWTIWKHQREVATWKRYPTITYRRHAQPHVVFCGGFPYYPLSRKFKV